MNIKFSLKTTNPLDLYQIFQQYILSKPGGQNAFLAVQQPFVNLN